MSSVNQKLEVMVAPTTAIASTDTVVGVVDMLGFDHVDIDIVTKTAVTTAPWLTCKLAESDTESSAPESMDDIAVFTGGDTDVGFVIPGTTAAEAQTIELKGLTTKFRVDCRGGKRKRWLGIILTPGVDSTTVCVIANKSKGDEAPVARDLVTMMQVQAG